jgi:hypothetical protein
MDAIRQFKSLARLILLHPAVACFLTSLATAAEPSPLVVTPNEFQGTDVERINQAIETAAATGGRVVVPRYHIRDGTRQDVWLIDSAILLQSDTTLELDNCRIKLSDRCRDNFIRSGNCGLGVETIQPMRNIHIRGRGSAALIGADHPRATGDAGKTIGDRTYGTDAGIAGESQTGDWRNIGILLAFVEGFSIEGLHIKDSHSWAISLERCSRGTLRDLDFASSEFKMIDGVRETVLNQDGIDLRMGCHDILIENVSGHTGDDLVALTAIPHRDSVAGSTVSTMVSDARDRGRGLDDIRHIILRNIKGYSRGGHHIVRLLNTSGVRLHDILLDGLIDTSPEGHQCKAAVKIGDSNYGGGIAPLGDTRRIVVTNVMSRAKHTILVGGSLSDSILSNLIRYGSGGEVVTIAAGEDYVRDLTISDVHVMKE